MSPLDIERRVYPERLPATAKGSPERFKHRDWIDSYPTTGNGGKYRRKPLQPRERLAVRLAILVEMKEAEIALMKEIMSDEESLADAKLHKGDL